MKQTLLVKDVAQSDNTIVSTNEHIGFFQEDKETPFTKVTITTARDKTPIVVYIKNKSQFLLNNIKLFFPTGIKAMGVQIPDEIKPNEGFFVEFEVNTKINTERFIQVETKPHAVVFE